MQISKAFGTPMEKVLYVFDHTQDAANIDLNTLAQQVGRAGAGGRGRAAWDGRRLAQRRRCAAAWAGAVGLGLLGGELQRIMLLCRRCCCTPWTALCRPAPCHPRPAPCRS